MDHSQTEAVPGSRSPAANEAPACSAGVVIDLGAMVEIWLEIWVHGLAVTGLLEMARNVVSPRISENV